MREETINILSEGARRLGEELSPRQLSLVDLYLQELLTQSRRLNLSAVTEEKEAARKHFIDSWTCCRAIGRCGSLIDVGSGAGLPGLPIKIIRPRLSVTLLESVAKKAAFLLAVVERLNLPGVTVVTGRAETEGRRPQHRERYDYATCRAVGSMAVVAELCLPLLRVGGVLIAQRGKEGEQEAARAAPGLACLGGRLKEVVSVKPFTGADNFLVLIEKIGPTPEPYPRRSGMPQKRPLWK
ncbi:MAG: 16S rRNA (guanine(527)-N(7))-methyltransferase RsmG [Syntrophomonadaceae bacterium]|nr:16S rRNA (guanine(527)-N(7))-methyltransferase RsmG [Syntrophomonadaceae bacterium]